MTRNSNTPNSEDSNLTNKKNSNQSFTQSACYRGFTSIDQEMEREIAMQWFKPAGKSKFLSGIVLLESKSK